MEEYPRIRAIDAFPVMISGQRLIALRDPMGYTRNILYVPDNVFFMISLFDGEHAIRDIQSEYASRYGDLIFQEKIQEVVETLDRHYMLESERFRAHHRQLEEAFRKAPVREASHAGLSYEADAEALRAQLDGFFREPEGPGEPDPGKALPGLRGFVAPHIDLRRGGSCFAHAYKVLGESVPPDLFVIFGTGHRGVDGFFSFTRKGF